MTETVATRRMDLNAFANQALRSAACFWFLVAVAGQWIFASYVAIFYGGSAMRGDLEAWNKVLPHGYVVGATLGNAMLAAHLLFAAIITVGGPLQLVPRMRSRFPRFHRWNGRLYMLAALVLSVGGLYLTLSGRTLVGDLSQQMAVRLNAILILVFGVYALRSALARDFRAHRRWALRLFLAVSGVWFFRVGLMLWLVVNKGPVGFDMKSFTGPFLSVLGFAQYLLPLAVLELYLYTRERAQAPGRLVMAASLIVLTLAMGVGIFGATMGMWLPRI